MPRIKDSIKISHLDASRRDSEVGRLQQPWIAHEGPFQASFQRGLNGDLLPRGLAFDARTTVIWDEDAVQVIEAASPEPNVIALRSQVLLRKRFGASAKGQESSQGASNGDTDEPDSLAKLQRIDYLRQGVLIGSRYLKEDDHA